MVSTATLIRIGAAVANIANSPSVAVKRRGVVLAVARSLLVQATVAHGPADVLIAAALIVGETMRRG